MTAKIISGNKIAEEMRAEMKIEIEQLKSKHNLVPGLAVVLVGENPASVVYVRNKKKSCEEIGINSYEHKLPADTSEEKLLALVDKLNADDSVHGILVQLPLPKQIDENKVLNKIIPTKDVDGFHPFNVGRMLVGDPIFLPCTPHGVQQMLIRSGVKVEGSHVVIVGRSNIVGKPVAAILVQKAKGADATVTICHSRTKNLPAVTQLGDILIAAIGVPEFVKADMVREGAVVIDVGVNRVEDKTNPKGFKLVGDVDFEAVKAKASAISPVPGGVGPMTITMLLHNTIRAAKLKHNIA
ncbi:bifunctional methylenetetrahydrofolate dehydrogenase/methenyltetrahydrofolate cyclohydrolase FolD [Candidatus Poribacteria bacterium]|nr:bifunctional methylenetetrahydrofolate dehydrogenase/methenyltetrahydrofolate cyclohydrolase FolD [Candidatus Poribacteria bacterium]